MRKISSDAGMPFKRDPVFVRYMQGDMLAIDILFIVAFPCTALGVENVENWFRQLASDFEGLQLIMVVLPGKTPVYGECLMR